MLVYLWPSGSCIHICRKNDLESLRCLPKLHGAPHGGSVWLRCSFQLPFPLLGEIQSWLATGQEKVKRLSGLRRSGDWSPTTVFRAVTPYLTLPWLLPLTKSCQKKRMFRLSMSHAISAHTVQINIHSFIWSSHLIGCLLFSFKSGNSRVIVTALGHCFPSN